MTDVFKQDKNDSFARTFYRFVELSNKTEMAIKKALKPFGLTHAQLNVLYVLASKYPEKIHPADLKKHLIVSNPDITRMVDRLVGKNWVHREICPENRRMMDINITSEGMQVFEEAHYAAKVAVGDFFKKDLEEKETEIFRDLLRKINIQ